MSGYKGNFPTIQIRMKTFHSKYKRKYVLINLCIILLTIGECAQVSTSMVRGCPVVCISPYE